MSKRYRFLFLLSVVATFGMASRAVAQNCPCSIWSATTTPGAVDSGDASSGEFGVRFKADVSGTITGIRFYKSAANTGSHVGNLWTNTGTLLASVVFAGESSTGWQQANFSSPVAITAGTVYVASYFTPTGHYSHDPNFFSTAGVDRPPLHALADGVSGANAIYSYSSVSTFPTSTFSSSNYWVDVVFTTTAPTQGPTVTSFSPANGVAAVSTGTAITATFNEAVDSTTVNNNTFQLLDSSNGQVSATVTYNNSTFTATLQPSSPLLPSANYTAVVKGGATDPRVMDTSSVPMPASVTWSFATASPPGSCPCSVWTSAAIPGTVDSGDASAGEFGVRFRSDVSGFITGIRYYKSATNTGTHIGNLWSNAGALLATATFAGESSTGWQQVNFGSPVAVTAGITYVASYFAPGGHHSLDQNFFTTAGVDNVPLHALATGVDGSNGVFAYSAGSTFPASTFNASNYWVDVVFSTTLPSQPPVVTSFSPANGAAGVSTTVAVTATFNKALDPTSVNSSTFQLLDASNNVVSASVTYNSSTLTATLQPTAALANSTTYTAIISAGGIKDSSETPMAASYASSFTTISSTPPPIVTGFSPGNGASGISTTTAITATFNKAIDPTTINANTFQLLNSSNTALSASVSYNSSTFTATLQPLSPLAVSSSYTVVLHGGTVDPRVKDTSGTALAANVSWVFATASVASQVCPCSIWSLSSVPVNLDSGDATPVEIGVKFRSDVSGLITGIRFYKSVANTGIHKVNLWTNTGTLLASSTAVNESSSGWQQVTFNSPVAITSGTTYVASYFAPSGHYSFDQAVFNTVGVDNAPLHALSTVADGGDGVYTYAGTSAFPSSTFNGSNYWVDVVFVSSNSTAAPVVLSTQPTTGATGVGIGATLSAGFSEPIDPSTVNSSTFLLVDSSSNPVSGTVSYVSASASAVFTATTDLQSQITYTATIKGTVKDIFGNAMGSDLSWSFTTSPAPANSGPGGPILVISSAQNPFSRYYGEILLNEGMNEFTVQDISTVTSTVLAGYDLAILGDMHLTSAQVSMLTSWVNGGGRLIAMHPDKQLAGLLGLTSTSSTLSDQYLLTNTTVGPGVGIVGQSIQFHGSADLYSLNGANSFATLYSSATAPTASPAVTWVNAGSGQAAAFTYDLARSVVYTRQGNPAWSGEDRDGYIDPAVGSGQIRSDDLFWGAATFDPQPDWVDLNNVAIPQADEQQRLLVNLIQLMNVNKKPLPRFWYFPSGFKAVVVMTGDDHDVGGTSGRFDQYINDSSTGCSVADWACVRSTSYIWTSTPIPNYQTYVSQGFEIANHTDNVPSCTNFTPASLESAITTQLAEMQTNYPNLPVSKTNRTHCVLWSDYDSEPQILLNHGIRFDTSYYYWPGIWTQNRSGLFTGSGLPMRYADRNGNTIDVYQATTQMPDENPWDYDLAISSLLDNALGPQGYYGAFTVNMHTDQSESAGSDAIVAAAQSRSVPIVSSLQMLTWLDGRNSSSFGVLSWNGSTLSFSITAGTGARNLQAMLPVNSSAGSLISLKRGTTTVTTTTQTIKGVQYAVFVATAGSYSAQYGPGGVFSIAGTLTGPGAPSATVKLTGTSSATVTADPTGHYLITGRANGTYTVTPSKAGMTFTPASQNVAISGANVTGVNFTSAVTPTFSVSGSISGSGGNSATVTLSGGSTAATVIADTSGNFIFNGIVGGTYTVTPSKGSYTFTPTNRSVTVNGANVTGVTFTSGLATSTTLATDAVIFKDSASSSTSITTPTFSTTVGNELLLAFIGTDYPGSGPNTTVTGVTGAGLTWVLVQRTNAQFGTSEIWRALAPVPLSNATVTANLSVAVGVSSITVVSFTGVDLSGTNGSGAIGATGSGNGVGPPAATLTTTRSNSLVFGVGNDWDASVARTVGPGQSLVHQYLPGVDTFWVQRQNSAIANSGTLVSIDDSEPDDDRFNLSIVEIRCVVPTLTLSGTISGAGGNAATVNLTGSATATVTADASGNYSFPGLVSGSYTVTPVHSGWAFTPTSRTVTITNANVGSTNFTSTAVPLVTFSPASLAFASQPINTTSAAQTITLSNTGNATLTITSVAITGTNPSDFAQITTCGDTLAAGASCTINITFKPTSATARSALVSVTDNAGGSPHTVPLTGTGTSPAAQLSPTSEAFGVQLINTTSTARTVTLANTGNSTLSITSISFTGTNAADFTRTTTCGTTLAAGASCNISVTFRPAATGARSANLSVTDNAPGSPHTIPLTGTGTAVTVSPTSLAFTSQAVGITSAAKTVTVTNSGATALTVISISFTGTNATDFAQTNTCGTSVAAGRNCTINVTFTPLVQGARLASLRIADSDPTSPQLVTLTGTGTGAAAQLSPTSLRFAAQVINTTSSSQTVRLSNVGNATMSITSIAFTGANAADFARTTTCGTTLAAGSSCNISVTFRPTATGSRTARLSVTDSAPGSPQTAPLTGTGTAVTVSPTSLTYTTQTVGTTSAAKTVTVTNSGTTALTGVGISFTGTNATDFAQTNTCGTSLAAARSCTISVSFRPLGTGIRSATLRIADSDPTSPQQVSVIGAGR
jgi:hypothetical protein